MEKKLIYKPSSIPVLTDGVMVPVVSIRFVTNCLLLVNIAGAHRIALSDDVTRDNFLRPNSMGFI